MRTSELTERRMGQLAGAIAARDAECVTLRRQRQELTSSRHVQDAELKKLLTKRSLLENESRMLQEAVSVRTRACLVATQFRTVRAREQSAEEEVARSKRQILMLGGECKELRESVLAQRATLAALAPHRHTTGARACSIEAHRIFEF